jgi:hypothetical protein
MTPTQRSLAHLRSLGFTVAITEHWNQYAHIRQDLFGFGDLLAFRSGQPGSVLVQTTSGANHAARRTKILANPIALDWLKAGNWILLQSWRKGGAAGKRKLWTEKSEYICLDQFPLEV